MSNKIAKTFSWYTSNINKIIFLTCLFTLVVFSVERIALIFSYEGHLAGIDNNFDFPVIRYLAGYPIYPDPNVYPFVVNPYAPLYFIVSKWIASSLHIHAENVISVYRVTRSVAFVADAGTCYVLFLLLKKVAKCTRQTAIIAIAFFYTIICYLGYTFNRSDCLFLFFNSCTFFILLSNKPGGKIIKPLLLSILVVLTIFSKQNGITLILLIPLWLMLNRNFIHLILFILFTTILLSSTFWYFQYVFTDHTFALHIVNALKNRIDPRWFYIYIFKLMATSPLILPLAVALVITIKSLALNHHSFLSKLGILYAVQLIFVTGLSLKWGSSLGYFNESFFTSFLVISVCFTAAHNQASHWQSAGILTYLYPVLLIFIIHATTQMYFYFLNGRAKNEAHYNEQLTVSRYLKKEIGDKNNYVLDLNAPDVNFFKNILYKESAAPNFDAVDCCTLPDHIFDYRELVNGLQNGKIRFLIEKKGKREESLWNINLDRYKMDTTMFEYSIYKFDN